MDEKCEDCQQDDLEMITNIGACTFQCIQRAFVLAHVLLGFTGAFVFAIGIMLFFNTDDVMVQFSQESDIRFFFNAAIFLIVIGSITLVTPFIACVGTVKYNLTILYVYLALLILICVGELTALAVSHVYRDQVEDKVSDIFLNSLAHYGDAGYEKLTLAVNSLQKQYECCGKNSHHDWHSTNWGKAQNGSFPSTCCSLGDVDVCVGDKHNDDDIYKNGCYLFVEKFHHENLHLISGFSVWIIVLDMLCILFLVLFIVQVRRRQRDLYLKDYNQHAGY